MNFRTGQGTGFDPRADRDRFHGRNRHDCLREPSIQFQIPGRVGTKTRWNTARDHFEDAAKSVAFAFLLVDQCDHLLLRIIIATV